VVYKWYILPIGGLYITYHLLREPETTIDFVYPTWPGVAELQARVASSRWMNGWGALQNTSGFDRTKKGTFEMIRSLQKEAPVSKNTSIYTHIYIYIHSLQLT